MWYINLMSDLKRGIKVSAKKLLKVIAILLSLVHCIILTEMLYIGVKPMVVYNIFSILCYLIAVGFINKEHYNAVFIATYFEIILHSFLATVFLGWESGFALYMIALVPVGFYMQYFISGDKYNIKQPLLLSILDFVIFISCRAYSVDDISLNYKEMESVVHEGMYTFNAFCTFATLIGFSVIFIMELNRSHDELMQVNEKLGRMAKLDTLTGLFNRRGIQPFLDICQVSGRNFCIAMCDIDDFKHVNDSYGHDVGDEVIAKTAKTIRAGIKPDDHVCRWGGEEFVFLIDSAQISDGYTIADNIRRTIEKSPLEIFGKTIGFTVTIGVTEYQQGEAIEQTIVRADELMYSGKKNGKNVVICASE